MECFVCAGTNGPFYSVCKCPTVIHQACLCRLLTVPSHSSHCAVCKTPYHITEHIERECKCSPTAIVTFFFLTTMLSSILMACFLLSGYGVVSIILISGFASMAVMLFIFMGFAIVFFFERNGKLLCCSFVEHIVKRVVELGPPVEKGQPGESRV